MKREDGECDPAAPGSIEAVPATGSALVIMRFVFGNRVPTRRRKSTPAMPGMF